MRKFPRPTWLLLSLALCGCANLNSIHREDAPFFLGGSGRAIIVDAKQRAIVASKVEVPVLDAEGNLLRDSSQRPVTQIEHRYCSEPSPDVLSALSTSAAGDLGVTLLKSGDEKARARGSLAISESAATIERTQTINLLRESMFRTCERYLNGAINADQLTVQASRDQRAMVAILAIEQLTKSARPASTTINAGTATASYSEPVVGEALKALEVSQSVAQKRDDAAQQDFDNLSCKTVLAAPQPDQTANPTGFAAFSKCNTLNDNLTKANQNLRTATDQLTQLATQAGSQSLSISASAGANAQLNGGGGTVSPPLSDAAIASVAEAVTKIVDDNNQFPEVDLFCISYLGRNRPDDLTKGVCLEYVKSRINLQISQNLLLAAQVGQKLDSIQATISDQRKQLQSFLSVGGDDIATKWTKLLNKAGVSDYYAKKFAGQPPATSIDDILARFGILDEPKRTAIIDATKVKGI